MVIVVQGVEAFSALRLAVIVGLGPIHVAVSLVLVMPQVTRLAGRALMLAIRHRRSPDGLQWHQHQQKNGDPSAHSKSISGSDR